MDEMPKRIARLPRDKRGYPIPWNVLRGSDGTPLFTVNDSVKHMMALQGKLCPICGEPLGVHIWFVGGPLSAFHPNGRYIDLPSHKECAEFSLRTCPHLSAPKYTHRIDHIINEGKVPEGALLTDPTVNPDRPAVFVMVRSSGMKIYQTANGIYVRPDGITGIEYWNFGKQLSEAEGVELVRISMGEGWVQPKI